MKMRDISKEVLLNLPSLSVIFARSARFSGHAAGCEETTSFKEPVMWLATPIFRVVKAKGKAVQHNAPFGV